MLDIRSDEVLSETLKTIDAVKSGLDLVHPNIRMDQNAKTVYLFLFAKSVRTFKAFAVLVRQGYAHEADILLRAIFESLVDWLFIRKEPEQRSQRYLLYQEACRSGFFRNAKHLKDLIPALPMNVPVGVLDQASDAERDFCNRYGIKNGRMPNGWCKQNIRERAEEVGLLKSYLTTYKTQCDFAHGGHESIMTYLDFDAPATLALRTEPGWGEHEVVILDGCRLILHCMVAADTDFGLDCADLISTALDCWKAYP